MKINIKELAKSILIPVVLGTIIGLVSSSFSNYSNLNLPTYAPSAIVFPIVWTILYILMGVSNYLIKISTSYYRRKSLFIYNIQLTINLLWSIIFFVFNLKTFAFIWIILLIFTVIIMIKNFYHVSKIASYLQIPYLLWLVFAAFLNLSIIFIN